MKVQNRPCGSTGHPFDFFDILIFIIVVVTSDYFCTILQGTLQELMEHVVSLLQQLDTRRKQITVPSIVRKKLNECLSAVLKNITMVIAPSAYFRGIINLIGHSDGSVHKKVQMLSLFTM